MGNACVGKQYIDTAKMLYRLIHHIRDFLLLGYIRFDEQRFKARSSQFVGNRLAPVGIIRDNDLGPLFCKQSDCRFANPAGAPRHNDNLGIKFHALITPMS
ncbi:Uncharacterised protein [Actinobacillus pleuropneumoniae]|nr:Uncharacterised protein [Actinobacillus pleuropneumoniae]